MQLQFMPLPLVSPNPFSTSSSKNKHEAPDANLAAFKSSEEKGQVGVIPAPRVKARFGEFSAEGANRSEALAKIKADSYSHILGHEQAHASAAGALAGGITINYNQDGIATSGSVPIHFGFNPADPESSYRDAQKAASAAMAPSDPSGQDYAVAAKAQSIMGQSQVLMQNKNKALSLPFQG